MASSRSDVFRDKEAVFEEGCGTGTGIGSGG